MFRFNQELIAPLAAAAAYGSWGAYSNWEFGLRVILAAGIVQGLFAFISTWTLAELAKRLLSYCRRKLFEKSALVSTYLGCSGFLWTVPSVMHFFAGTQSILMAMLPGLVVGHCYLFWVVRRISQ